MRTVPVVGGLNEDMTKIHAPAVSTSSASEKMQPPDAMNISIAINRYKRRLETCPLAILQKAPSRKYTAHFVPFSPV